MTQPSKKVIETCVAKATKASDASGEEFEDVLFDVLVSEGISARESLEIVRRVTR